MKNESLKKLMNESAQIHAQLICKRASDIKRNIVAVKHALQARRK